MKTTREFCPADRYLYDFMICTAEKGWAQVDTSQDASYFGTWANPFKLLIFSYTEGDTCLHEAETEKEFVEELENIKTWNTESGHKFLGIDPGFNEELKAKFNELTPSLIH